MIVVRAGPAMAAVEAATAQQVWRDASGGAGLTDASVGPAARLSSSGSAHLRVQAPAPGNGIPAQRDQPRFFGRTTFVQHDPVKLGQAPRRGSTQLSGGCTVSQDAPKAGGVARCG
ncbi:hypothetical protein GCM10023085_33410 [Actinomadura viridis]